MYCIHTFENRYYFRTFVLISTCTCTYVYTCTCTVGLLNRYFRRVDSCGVLPYPTAPT